jgi:pimeloyl-ACP methyl ester carboxylesterase
MQRDSIGQKDNKLEVCFLAGLATSPLFMEKLRIALLSELERNGLFNELRSERQPVHSELLFPYGDWRRKVIPQLWEIRSDLRLRPTRIANSIGGNRALEAIRKLFGSNEEGGKTTTILIGHSGGGAAAVHAGQLLLEKGYRSTCLVVMVGSPRCRIPERLKPYTLSIHAAGKGNGTAATRKSSDLVSRIGTHGGWTLGGTMASETEARAAGGQRKRFPYWQKDKHAPSGNVAVRIIGKHADYFRDSEPYVNADGKSNLEVTLGAILSWLALVKL